MPGTNFVLDYVDPWRPPHIVFTWAYRNLDDTEFSVRRADYPFNSLCTRDERQLAQCAEVGRGVERDQTLLARVGRHRPSACGRTGPRDQRASGDLPRARARSAAGAVHRLRQWRHVLGRGARRRRGRSPSTRPSAGSWDGSTRSSFYLEFFKAYIVGFEEEARACGRMVRTSDPRRRPRDTEVSPPPCTPRTLENTLGKDAFNLFFQ